MSERSFKIFVKQPASEYNPNWVYLLSKVMTCWLLNCMLHAVKCQCYHNRSNDLEISSVTLEWWSRTNKDTKYCPHPLTTANLPSIQEASPRSTLAQIHMDTGVTRGATQVSVVTNSKIRPNTEYLWVLKMCWIWIFGFWKINEHVHWIPLFGSQIFNYISQIVWIICDNTDPGGQGGQPPFGGFPNHGGGMRTIMHSQLQEMKEVTGFDDKAVRRAFIRKVYGILMVQLIVTAGIMAVFMFVSEVKMWADF